MAATISKEATLSEVLGEVSMLDVGLILKRTLTGLGCLGILILIGIGLETGANYAMPGFHVPSWLAWVFWLVVAWGWLAEVAGRRVTIIGSLAGIFRSFAGGPRYFSRHTFSEALSSS